MGKHKKKQNKNTTGIVLVVVLSIILAALLAVFVLPQFLYRVNSGDEPEIADPAEQTETAAESDALKTPLDAMSFPVLLESDRLRIDSVFSYSGINPDSGGQDVSDIVAINMTNLSDQHLKKAVLTATLVDGTVTTFTVDDLPSQKSVTVFAADNHPYAECAALSVDAAFMEVPSPDGLSVFVNGLTVTVVNNSTDDLSQIDVYCRDVFGESYFGGTTYKHTIDELPAGQSTTIDVNDSMIGMIEVVRIAINES